MSVLFNWLLDSVTDCVCIQARGREIKKIKAIAGGAEQE